MAEPHIELRNVYRTVTRQAGTSVRSEILRGVNLNVLKGELITIMGPSGAGKSTLLRLINRLTEADSGTILLDSANIKDYDPRELRRRVGMVFQIPVVFKGSVRDNLAFGTKLWNTDADIEALAAEAAIPGELMDADAAHLSVGEKQRVCIARALANKPEALLLDEPTSALDKASAEKVESLLLRLQSERHLTMLWVTHDQAQARRISRHNYVLEDGKLREEHG
ncbi:ABC transporter ATP-binding protein [Methanocella sp. MCL-LM]|uniref:ABC transporter ATP-binding protein n=1 Tax=Methanocella sp. MCL-LM TaxID=3412035 RepID=UPI003C7627E0